MCAVWSGGIAVLTLNAKPQIIPRPDLFGKPGTLAVVRPLVMDRISAVFRYLAALVVWCILGVATSIAESGERIPVERRLPPNVVYFSAVRDVPKFRLHALETSSARLGADPQFRTWSPAGFGKE